MLVFYLALQESGVGSVSGASTIILCDIIDSIWRVGSTADFLELTAEEAALVETRLALSLTLRKRRASHHLTQAELARRLRSSQSRVAKMEAGDKSVSVDLLLRALFSLGAKPRDIGRALQRPTGAAA